METIFWISVTLFVIAAFAVGHTVRQHNKMFNDNEDPVPFDDRPAQYEDIEYCEQPFVEYY